MERELIDSLLNEIHNLNNKSDESQKLVTAKTFVKDKLMGLREDDAGECILALIKHLELKSSYGSNLKGFYKIERQAPKSEKQSEPDEIGITDEMRSKALKQALEIMRSGDPIQFIMDVVKKYHIGDEKTIEGVCVSVANQSCENSSGIQVAVNGGTGSGKSHGLKTVTRLIPSQYKVISALSPKAAYYMELKPGMIVFSDDVSMSVEMEEIIKRATTNYQEETKYNTVYNGESKPLVIPPRINWYLTSVESEVSKEVLNRQLTFSTVEDKDHKDTIFAKQQQSAVSGVHDMTFIDNDILVCRAIFNQIKSSPFIVRVPFAERINMENKSDSRIFPLFLDMIKGYTIFYQSQRKIDEGGFLLAEKEDFDRAKVLFESQIQNVVSKLNDREIKVMDSIYKYPYCDINGIAEDTGMPYQTIRNIIKGRPDRNNIGLLSKVVGLTMNKVDGKNVNSERFYVENKTWGEITDFVKFLP